MVSGILEKLRHEDIVWILSVVRITGGYVWKLEDDRSKLTLPDSVRQLRCIHAGFDVATELLKLPNIVVAGIR